MPDDLPYRWEPDRATRRPNWPMPPMLTAIGRGIANRCPGCGRAHVFAGYLRVVAVCPNCGAPLGLARADDAPPYFTILITGHVVVPLMLLTERALSPSSLVMAGLFVPFALLLSLALLRPVKGGTVGLMLKLDMLKTDADG